MARIVCRRKGELINMQVSGQATISNAEDVRNFLQKIYEGDQSECSIDLSQITEIDLSFFQLVISFYNTMIAADKKVILNRLPENHDFLSFAKKIGYNTEVFFA